MQSLTGVLEGVAPGVFLSSGAHNAAHSCAVEFTASPAASSSAAMPSGSRASSPAVYTSETEVFNLLTTAQSPAGTNRLHVTLTLGDGTEATGTFDITDALQQLMADNGGERPGEISLSVTLHLQETTLNATVEPWDETGTGSGEPRPQA